MRRKLGVYCPTCGHYCHHVCPTPEEIEAAKAEIKRQHIAEKIMSNPPVKQTPGGRCASDSKSRRGGNISEGDGAVL